VVDDVKKHVARAVAKSLSARVAVTDAGVGLEVIQYGEAVPVVVGIHAAAFRQAVQLPHPDGRSPGFDAVVPDVVCVDDVAEEPDGVAGEFVRRSAEELDQLAVAVAVVFKQFGEEVFHEIKIRHRKQEIKAKGQCVSFRSETKGILNRNSGNKGRLDSGHISFIPLFPVQ